MRLGRRFAVACADQRFLRDRRAIAARSPSSSAVIQRWNWARSATDQRTWCGQCGQCGHLGFGHDPLSHHDASFGVASATAGTRRARAIPRERKIFIVPV
jgi:hypothetical protein